MLAQLANQEHLYLAFCGEDGNHRLTQLVSHDKQQWQYLDDLVARTRRSVALPLLLSVDKNRSGILEFYNIRIVNTSIWQRCFICFFGCEIPCACHYPSPGILRNVLMPNIG